MVRRTVLFVVVVTLLASAGWAVTTGRMAGTVLDNDGLALPGVTVQISSPQLIGGPQIAITGTDGGFAFNLLAPGAYTVEANLAGFQPAVGEIRVQLNRVAAITFNMVPEQFGGEIMVTAQVPVVDTTQVNASVVFDEAFLQKAAVGASGRDYLSIIGMAAGVAGSGNASVFGGSSGDNSFLIDGLNTTDPVTGTFGTNFNYDAIQEVNFQTGGFEAEFGQATGGIINLVTKSGGNQFSGSLDARYRDQSFTEKGDHFDPDTQDSSFENYSGTLGGPILRDRVWFFTSVEYSFTSRQDVGAQFPRTFDGWNYIGKVTWQAADAHRVVAKWTGSPADIDGVNSDRFSSPEASGTQFQDSSIWQAELNSVLSDTLLLNAQIGLFENTIDVGPTSGDHNTPGHTVDGTIASYNNYDFVSLNDRFRDEYRLNMSLFVDDFAGAHELKAGVEYSDMEFDLASYYTGGGFFFDSATVGRGLDLNGDGFLNHYVVIKEPEETAQDITTSRGNITTFFLQDAWRPLPNLTVKPGIRLDTMQLSNHVGDDIADMDRWQPRLGVAWDLFGNAKHVLRASGGRFMDPTALSIPSFASGVTEIYHEYNTLEYYCNQVGICEPDDPRLSRIGTPIPWTNWQGQQYYLIDNRSISVYEPAETVDQLGVGRLQAPYADELIFAYETQLFPQTSLELTYVKKKTEEMIEDTCRNNTWAWGDGAEPTLDNSSSWTTAAGCSGYAIVNMPGFGREYTGYIAKFETRKEKFHVLLSYTWSESEGNTSNGAAQSYATALADFFPVHFVNQQGYLPDHREHRVKLNGYFLLPWDITLGIDGFYSSPGHATIAANCDVFANAFSNPNYAAQIAELGIDPNVLQYCYSGDGALLPTTIYLRPRGDYTTKSIWQVDLQLSKTFKFGSVDLTGIVAVYNAFDNEADATFQTTPFVQARDANGDPVVDAQGFPVPIPIGTPTSYWLPRRYEVGLRLEF